MPKQERDARKTMPLAGTWDFRQDTTSPWREIPVPLPWEWAGVPKNQSGPFTYRRRVTIPPEWVSQRLWLECDGASYHTRVLVDGRDAGEHTGTWDAWSLELTGLLKAGSEHELMLIVEKPASLTNGPDSPHLPGRFPLRETLSGFLPYVWGHAFGGLWQDIRLAASGPGRLGDVHAHGTPDGAVRIEAELDHLCAVRFEVLDGEDRVIASDSTPAAALAAVDLRIPEPQAWSPHSPRLYRARVSVQCVGGESDVREVSFGLRQVSLDGARLLLNGQPTYPRMALSWGWYPVEPPASPSPETVREEFRRLKERGFNGVKLCLWQPPEHYFRIADEEGMLLWLELPLWLPHMTEALREQIFREYDALVKQARNHPSVVLYTLGCELNAETGAEILEPLYRRVKHLIGDALLRDNSGSGEAYGGLLDEFAEFRDYHFYSELPFFRPLVEHFSPDYRPTQPWLFGEYADIDSFRDPRRLAALTPDGTPPWWASPDLEVNPVGARWQHDLPWHEERLRENGMLARTEQLEAVSGQQALLHRKWTLEATRLYAHLSGYVITGLADTPISTAGLWDDLGRDKAPPAEYRAFNDDLLALAGWDRRRSWIGGGDRPAYWDNHCYLSGSQVRAHAVVSNYSGESGVAEVEWAVTYDEPAVRLALGSSPPVGEAGRGVVTSRDAAAGSAEDPLRDRPASDDPPPQPALRSRHSAQRCACPTREEEERLGGEGGSVAASGRLISGAPVSPGELTEIGVAVFRLPEVEAPRRLTLSFHARIGQRETSNRWPLWVFPERPWADLSGVHLLDPGQQLAGLARLAPGLVPDLAGARVAVATAWTPELAAFVEAGGRAVLVHSGGGMAGPLPTVEVPWWREAVKLIEPHPAWGDFPHDGWAGLQFFSLAPDRALDASGLPAGRRPILRRVDARTTALHEYALEMNYGAGRLIVTTLRFMGGLGDQAVGIERNPAASHLLARFARHLSSEEA